jgi:glutathione S-transferase
MSGGCEMAIIVYNYPLSPCGEKVRFALLEKGLAFTDRHVDLGNKENLQPDFLSLNPKGLVPVLVDGTVVVSDSTVIIEYLEDRWPDNPLRPATPLGRAHMRRWTKFVDEVLHPAWPGIAWPILVRSRWLTKASAEIDAMLAALPDQRRRERQVRLFEQGLAAFDSQEAVAVFTRTCEAMEAELGNGLWLVGEEYSLADIALLPYFVALDVFGLEKLFADFDKVAAWYRLACTRPCFKGHPKNVIPVARLREVEQILDTAAVTEFLKTH